MGLDKEYFLSNLTRHVDCETNSASSLVNNVQQWILNAKTLKNGTFCELFNTDFEDYNGSFSSCFINEEFLSPCCIKSKNGNHTLTFWFMCGLYLLFKLHMNSSFAIMDGLFLNAAKKHSSKYSYFLFFQMFGSTISPLIASLIIKDSDDNGINSDYSLAYYVTDGILFLLGVIVQFVDFKMEDPVGDDKNNKIDEEKNVEHKSGFAALPKLVSIPSFVLVIGIASSALQWVRTLIMFLKILNH